VTAGHDHTCRVWKVPEESQLIFRARAPALDAVRYVTGTEWLSGGADGALALWRRASRSPAARGRRTRRQGRLGMRPLAGLQCAPCVPDAGRSLKLAGRSPQARRLPQCGLAARSPCGHAGWLVGAAACCYERRAVLVMVALARMRCCRPLPRHLVARSCCRRSVCVLRHGWRHSSEPVPRLLCPPHRRRRVRLSSSQNRPQRGCMGGRAAAK